MKTFIAALAVLVVTLLVPAAARAHEGHVHKVMGTVSSIDGSSVMVKGTDGKSVMVMLDAKTKITRGEKALDASALKSAIASSPKGRSTRR